MSTTDYDVGLFETITALIREQHEASRENRRGNVRHPFDCVQLLAPYDGEHLPDLDELRPVLCHDLSRCGFSYLASEKPVTHHVVAALGSIPPKFFIAEILHVHPTMTVDGYEYKVGCRFLRRLE
jgi:hypothetical protein